jgi:predicted RNA-binding Zn-ribbon protein involved in translation (DUF1610 family)
MTTATPTQPTTTPLAVLSAAPIPAFTLPCPKCGADEASISIHTDARLEDGNAFSCNECDGEISATEVRTIIRRWTKFLACVEAMSAAMTAEPDEE